ncbi:MFS transporter [Nocardioides mesophilus]|uniref:MFS transporter n=1 Tax=Nocardioides mesophilus TaxID=433659 RepID=A0A7G9R8B5_9ACTN|nr:MFS transporter [Nocardioides mesophilus]QNN51840.1 MFS transporter [Nocardioides mesophilus]
MSHDTTAVAAPAAVHPAPEPEVRRPWTILGVMLMAQFMVILDVSVVNVALPSIGKALHFTSTDYQWTVSAYVLLSGGLLLFGGRLSDLLDRRAMFLTGLGLFTAASLVSATASSATMMILSRGAQGAGAAMLTPAAMAIIVTSYSGRQRASALAIWGTISSMGIAAGVLFGGILTTVFGWQAVFFINVPIGIVAAILAVRTVAAGRRTGSLRRLDAPGAATVVTGLLALVFAIEGTRTEGWASTQTLAAFALAVVLLGGFTLIERRVPAPLVPPATWRIRSLISASTVMAVITGAVVGAIFLSSLFLQTVLGGSAIITGLQFLPLAAAITVGAMIASKLLGRVTPKTIMVAGLLVVAVGATVLARIGTDPTYLADILPGFVVIGLGVGPMFVAISVAAMAGIPHAQSGLASGVMMTGHEVGAALGVATLAAIAGDLTTRTGLVDAYPRVFTVVALAMVALAGFAAVAVPRQDAHSAAHPTGHPPMH